mgnify:FL=1
MIITCLSCSTKYSIKKRVLGKNGKKVKCFNCGYEWYQKLDIIRKNLPTKSSKEKQIPTNYVKKEIDATKLFSSETTKKKNYRFLYLLVPIILTLFFYFNKEYFNYEIKNYFLKFIKKEFLINNQKKNSFDLIFNQIEKEVTILHNNQRVIKIFGKISNTSNIESYKIPKLQGTLIDSKNNIITTWFFNAEQDNLGPQESLNFNTSYIHDNQNIADIKIEFYKEVE